MAFSTFEHVKVSGIVTVLPEKKINIDDEIAFYDNNIKKLARIKKVLGLGTRYVVEDGVTCLDLCEEAAKILIQKMDIDTDTIDGVVVASSSHDFCAPADACILQGRLGLKESCTCFDISGLSCSAYVHALLTAHSFVSSGVMKKCLVLAGDMNSKHSDIRNRNSNMLYSDAGSATIVEYCEEKQPSWFLTGTQGSGWDKIILPASGFRLPIREDIANLKITDNDGNVWHLWDEVLKGLDIFRFTMNVGPKSIRELLEFSGLLVDDIDYFPIHQANGQIVKTVAQHAGIPTEKVSNETFTKYANCGAASVVSAVCDQLFKKQVDNIMLVSFGVGLSWGMAIINMKNCYNGGIHFYKKPDNTKTRQEQITYWCDYFKGDDNAS